MTRLAIIGTRVLACPGDRTYAARRIYHAIRLLRPGLIISGGAPGIDTIAQVVATTMGYSVAEDTLVIYRPSAARWAGPGGYRHRDGLIAAHCTHLLRLYCATSTTYGSGWTADEAERLGRQVVREAVCPAGVVAPRNGYSPDR